MSIQKDLGLGVLLVLNDDGRSNGVDDVDTIRMADETLGNLSCSLVSSYGSGVAVGKKNSSDRHNDIDDVHDNS